MSTIAVITPVYATQENGRLKYLTQAIRSVANQKLEGNRIVHLIVDDGSPADVVGLVDDYRKEQDADWLRYLRREKKPGDIETASNPLNTGIDDVLGNSQSLRRDEVLDLGAIAYLHSDDLLPPRSIQGRIEPLEHGWSFSDAISFDNNGKLRFVYKWRGDSMPAEELNVRKAYRFPHQTIMWSLEFLKKLKEHVASAYDQEGVFDPSIRFGEDLDVSLSSKEMTMKEGTAISHANEVGYLYRLHEDSITGNTPGPIRNKDLEAVARKHAKNKDKIRMGSTLDSRLLHDLPWSLFTYAPETLKSRLRPVRDFLKAPALEKAYPEFKKEVAIYLNEKNASDSSLT